MTENSFKPKGGASQPIHSSTNIEGMKDLVEEDSRHDVLTHIYSLSYFLQYFDDVVRKAKENKSILSLLYIDIDNLKYRNDHFGRTVTDDVLVKIASLIQNCTRPSDFLGRVGGDEFMVIMRETSRKEAEAIAEQMRTSVKSHPFNKRNITITTVICCSDEIEMCDARKFLMESDLQLEIAKNIRKMSDR
jgi:diguanylate cyclase (GGDEF)-like protein